jgi:hypothetical protein
MLISCNVSCEGLSKIKAQAVSESCLFSNKKHIYKVKILRRKNIRKWHLSLYLVYFRVIWQ